MDNRLQRLQNNILQALNLDCVLITDPVDVFYLSRFHSTNCILILSKDRKILNTDSRYTLAAAQTAPNFTLNEQNTDLISACAQSICDLGYTRVGIQDEHLSVSEYNKLSIKQQLVFVPIGQLMEELRSEKYPDELNSIRKAQSITDYAFSEILKYIKVGVTEKEVAFKLEYIMRDAGASSVSFDTIVASGKNSAMPHAVPTDKKIVSGDLVTMDFGCIVNSYCSDMTRTVAVGQPEQALIQIYDIVLEAQKRGLQALKPGIESKSVDDIVRGYITQMGYGPNFGHSTGHGVGLRIHEKPVLSFRSSTVLKPNQVVTVEPGIYVSGLGGVRTEDMCFITDDGYIDITESDKKLIIL